MGPPQTPSLAPKQSQKAMPKLAACLQRDRERHHGSRGRCHLSPGNGCRFLSRWCEAGFPDG
jgi:hypothetical protein